MHDPMTVAFEIKYPWKEKPTKYFPNGHRDTFITIWHVDPEKNGNDDSCDWFGSYRRLNSKEMAITEAIFDLESILYNEPFYPSHPAYLRFQKLKEAQRKWRQRGFRLHPRWHVWHWKIQIHPLQKLRRWLFSCCAKCGNGFVWGYSPVSMGWSNKKTRFFKGEEDVYHFECYAEIMKEL